jgi:hypothetical protein
MKTIHRWGILLLLLCLAIVCYMIGNAPGLGLFLLLGLCFEGAFWLGVLKTNKEQ